MKLRLLRDSRILHRAGEVVEASPAEAGFLISVGSAEPAEEAGTEAEAQEAKKTTKRKTTK